MSIFTNLLKGSALAALCLGSALSTQAQTQQLLTYIYPPEAECNQLTCNYGGYHAMGMYILGVYDGVTLNYNCTKPVTLSRDGVQIASLKPSSEITADGYMEIGGAAAMAEGDGLMEFPAEYQLTIAFDADENGFKGDAKFKESGKYVLSIPDGLLSYDGTALPGIDITYNYTSNVATADVEYTLNPADGSTVTDLNTITVTIPSLGLSPYYCEQYKQVTLTTPDGTVLKSGRPTMNGSSFTLSFKNADWADGLYNLYIPKGFFGTAMDFYNDDNEFTGRVQEITAIYRIGEPEQPAILSDIISPKVPASNEVSSKDDRYGCGMGVIELSVGTNNVSVNTAEHLGITISRDGELLNTIYSDDPACVMISADPTFSAADDEPSAARFIRLVFGGDPGDTESYEPYKQNGIYAIVIPNGAFILDNKALTGAEISYQYTNEQAQKPDPVEPTEKLFEYKLTPDPAQTVETNLRDVTLTFPNAKNVTYSGNGKMELHQFVEGKEAQILPGGTYPVYGLDGQGPENELLYRYRSNSIDWETGIYTVYIAPDVLKIDDNNFPGLTVKYYLGMSVPTAVEILGADKATSFDVYTIDGRVVVLGGNDADLGNLEPGLYIINGHKALVRK